MLAALTPAAGRAAPACSADWPMYGRGLDHHFQQDCTSLGSATVARLHPRWVRRTPDVVTASPAVVGDVLYDGDWAGDFYALDAATGRVIWRRRLDDGSTVSYGRITASPAVASFGGTEVVLAASGATLYALAAASGRVLAAVSLDPRSAAERSAPGAGSVPVEIESSPAVSGGDVFVGLDENETPGNGRTGLVALAFAEGPGGRAFTPLWKFDPETGRTFRRPGLLTYDPDPATDFGCGDVWTSPAVDPATGRVYFATANCQEPDRALAAGQLWSEAMFAVSAGTGAELWRFQPAALQPTPAARLAAAWADDDFGASPNLLTDAAGRRLDGEGQKSAVYWARDAASGRPAWSALAGQPGNLSGGGPGQGGDAVGGFIGSSAVQTGAGGAALRIVGATALPAPDPADPASAQRTTWAVRALDPASGRILWTDALAGPSYGATSLANGVAFVPDTFSDTLMAIDAATGLPLWAFPLDGPPSSTPVVTADHVYVGAGTGEQGPGGRDLLAGTGAIWAFQD